MFYILDGKSSRNSSDEKGTKSRRHTLTQEIKRRVQSDDKTNKRRRLSADDTKRRLHKSGEATRSHSHDSKRRRHNSDNTDLREKIDKAKLEDLKNLSKKLESNKSGKRQMKNSVEREGKRPRECTRSQERATSKRGFLKDGDKVKYDITFWIMEINKVAGFFAFKQYPFSYYFSLLAKYFHAFKDLFVASSRVSIWGGKGQT